MFTMLYALIALIAFALAASAQRPRPCETPKVWEGTVFQVVPNKNVTLLGKMSYDALNERVRIVEDAMFSGGKRSFFEYIMLYRKRRVYRIAYDAKGKKTCKVYKLYRPFRPAAIPRNVNFATQAYIGASLPGDGVLVDVFYGDYRHKGRKESYVTSVTADGCVPVHSWFYSKSYGVVHSSFYNIVLGIEDPSRFVPPRKCRPASLASGDKILAIF